jgi:hypothetical protein
MLIVATNESPNAGSYTSASGEYIRNHTPTARSIATDEALDHCSIA